jgi:hypothetical protein
MLFIIDAAAAAIEGIHASLSPITTLAEEVGLFIDKLNTVPNMGDIYKYDGL